MNKIKTLIIFFVLLLTPILSFSGELMLNRNWDGSMRWHPDFKKQYSGKCIIDIKQHGIINRNYKTTGGPMIKITTEKFKVGPIDVDYNKGTLNGVYHECLDNRKK
jgi:hypothetical protein